MFSFYKKNHKKSLFIWQKYNRWYTYEDLKDTYKFKKDYDYNNEKIWFWYRNLSKIEFDNKIKKNHDIINSIRGGLWYEFKRQIK